MLSIRDDHGLPGLIYAKVDAIHIVHVSFREVDEQTMEANIIFSIDKSKPALFSHLQDIFVSLSYEFEKVSAKDDLEEFHNSIEVELGGKDEYGLHPVKIIHTFDDF